MLKELCATDIIISLIGFLSVSIAGNGIVIAVVKRNWQKQDSSDITKKRLTDLHDVTNRQGKEIIMFTGVLSNTLGTQKLLVQLLHDKGLLNGESAPIIRVLDESEQELKKYERELKYERLMMEDGNE